MSKSFRAVAYEAQRGGALFAADPRQDLQEAKQDADEMARTWGCESTIVDGAATPEEITAEIDRIRQ